MLTIAGKKILIDAGLFQGPKEARARNWLATKQEIKEIEFLFLTHAHLDHSGFIPRLYKDGFTGKVLCTPGTQALARLILMDAGYLEEEHAKFANAAGYSRHKPAFPLFTLEDAKEAMKIFQPFTRNKWREFSPGLSFRFLRAGHIIGASMVQFHAMEQDKSFVVTFSGDIGHDRSRTMKGPARVLETDILVLESTYGGRLHDRQDNLDILARHINHIVSTKGSLLIPSFAVGRAQDIIFHIKVLEDMGKIPKIPVYLDSPMANEATAIFQRLSDDQKTGDSFNPEHGFTPSKFQSTTSASESRALSVKDGPIIIISSSGMLTGGRVLHHLKEKISHSQNMVLFTGYQAEGTKGRWLQDNKDAKKIRIHKEEIDIKAQIETLDGLSAHADYQDMIDWLSLMAKPPKTIILNHGAPKAQKAFAEKIIKELGIPTLCSCDNPHIDLLKIAKQIDG